MTCTPLFPIGTEHEVIDDQLGATVEEIRKRESAIRPLKLVGFSTRSQGIAIRRRVSVSRWREFLLGSEQFEARLHPFLARNDLMLHSQPPVC